jgi:hypothetical protein
MFAKWSILLFYQRLFGTRRWLKICVYVAMVVIFLWMVSVVLETFLLCQPLEYNWNTAIEGSCGDRNAVYVVAGATNMATDFMVLLIPVPTIWNLKMPTFQRFGLMATFSLGILLVPIPPFLTPTPIYKIQCPGQRWLTDNKTVSQLSP